MVPLLSTLKDVEAMFRLGDAVTLNGVHHDLVFHT